MDLKLTIETRPGLADIARDMAVRFAESGGCAPSCVARVGRGVEVLMARAAAEHPVAGCEVSIHFVADAEAVGVSVSYPAGTCGPGAAVASGPGEGRMPESVREAADEAEWRTEDGVRFCRLVFRIANGSR